MVINGYGNDAILRGAALRAQSVAELRALAIADGYAGFNIDFENLNNVDEAGLDSFITELAAALHPLGKKVIVDVGPRTSNANGYHVYNYQVLGQVADEVVLMAYDDHDIGSAPGPVAPLGWVQSIVNYARQEMPAQKILLGLAVYGYNWSSNGTTVELHDNQVAPLANAEGVPITWSSTDAESTFSYTASNGTVHQVWFEGSQSDAVRIALATQDHLGGVAIWRLGDETPAFWAALQGLK
jgi:spore germination protein